ncbi:hypothetical protein Maq22A_c18160 [Methylobacterium aquaticum]|uniref:Uncharacterized protein n=1 Tax=Methylobacterium aquaticum TaxID=270351 RepID=A0A0C6FUH0_9HYPH|nr:hypothetical protein Maq22A_c18160 [Methylobacterium aquaticum]
MQTQGAADAVARRDRRHHHHGDADEQAGSGRQQGCEAERGSEQDDGDFEDSLGAEGDAWEVARARIPSGAQGCAEHDREHQSLKPGSAEQVLLGRFEREGGAGHREAQEEAGQEAAQGGKGGCDEGRGGHDGLAGSLGSVPTVPIHEHSIQQNVTMFLFVITDHCDRADDDAGRRVDRFTCP